MNTIFHLTEYLDATVAQYPNQTAVVDKERTIVFSTLHQCAHILASQIIIELEGAYNQPIGIYFNKSIESVISDMAVLYSANAFMNLDVHAPNNRMKHVIDNVKPKLILSLKQYKKSLDEICKDQPNIKCLFIDDLNYEVEINSDRLKLIHSRINCLIDTDPCTIINTSGSTGTPKSVVLNHRSYINYTEWAKNTFDFSDNERIGCLSPIVFDHHNFILCMMMAKGSTLVLIPKEYPAFPAKIMSLLSEERVSFIFWVPTLMVNIANMGLLSKFDLTHLKKVWFAGEVFPTRQFNEWRTHLPDAVFANLYGPVEVTVDCTYYIIERELSNDEPIPIGSAFRNTDVLLLNQNDERCQVGESGEICVRGTSLSMGYYNNSKRTSSVFVQNPLNLCYPELIYRTGDLGVVNELGEIIFKGRKDTLIKHSGYRIELSEIEHVIVDTLALVNNCAVIYDFEKKRIVLFYENNFEIDLRHFRKSLLKELPKYMIPTISHKIEAMPRNTNGKINRLHLKELYDTKNEEREVGHG